MKRAHVLVIAVFVLLSVGFGIYKYRQSKVPAISYRQEVANRATIAQTILSTGTVKPVTRVDIKSPIAGRVETVLVREGDHVRKNQVLALTSSSERAALLDAARDRGPEELKKWEELQRPIRILAPIDGEIIARAIEPGQTFATTDVIFAMSDRLMVEAQVDETDIAQVSKDQEATLVLDAYPDQPITGRVYKIAYDAKTTNNVTTYPVDVLPDTVPPFMRSGMTANVTFEISKKEDVVSIPTEAIKVHDGKKEVLVPGVASDDPPRTVEIQTGMSDGKRTEVISGLDQGATVLIVQARTSASDQGTNPFMPSRPNGKRKQPGAGGGGGGAAAH
jgi:macrolide-specific efflux system membrane fusion protein